MGGWRLAVLLVVAASAHRPARADDEPAVRVMPQQVGLRCWNPLAFSPDRTRLLAAAFRCTDEAVADQLAIAEWDLRTGTLLHLIDTRDDWHEAVYLADGRRVLFGTRILDLDSARWSELQPSPEALARERAQRARWLRESDRRLRNLERELGGKRGRDRKPPPAPPMPPEKREYPIAISADGGRLVTAGDRGEVALWNLTDGSELRRVRAFGHEWLGPLFAISPDGGQLFVEAARDRVAVVDAGSGTTIATLGGHRDWLTAIRPVAGADQVVTAADDGHARLWSWRDGRQLRTFDHGAPITRLSGDDAGRILATVNDPLWSRRPCTPAGFKLWDLASGRLLMQHAETECGPTIETVRLCPDGQHAITLDPDEDLAHVYAIDKGKELRRIEGQRAVVASDCSKLAVWQGRGVAIFDPLTGGQSWRLEGSDADVTADVAALPGGLRTLMFSGNTPPGRPARGMMHIDRSAGGGPDPRFQLRLWDFLGLRPLPSAAVRAGRLRDAAVDAGGTRVLLDAGGSTELVDLDQGAALWKQPIATIGSVATSAGGRRLAWAQGERLVIADGSGKVIGGAAVGAAIDHVRLSADGHRALVVTSDRVAIVDADSGAIVRSAPTASHAWWRVATSADLRRAVAIAATYDQHDIHGGNTQVSIELWDLDSATRVSKTRSSHASAVALHPDHERIFIGQEDGAIEIWTPAGAEPINVELPGHRGRINGLSVSADGRYLISSSMDRTVRLWRLDTGASVALVSSGDQWVVYSDDGYFDASRHGGDLVMAVSAGRSARIDQLALRYNRPDILLERMGLGTPELIQHFRARHQRRLNKLGLDEQTLTSRFDRAPVATFAEVRQRDKLADLAIDLSSEHADLAGYNVWVNDVPLHGAAGVSVTGRRHRAAETIELTAGTNKIEVGVRDRGGAESMRDVRVLEYTGTARGDLYFLGFGVSRYRDPALDLQFAHKDVLDLAAVAADMRGAFGRVHVRTYVDEQVTTDAIRAAKSFLAPARVDDTVILMVAGHGTYGGDAEAQYYFVTHDAEVARLGATAAPFELFEELLQGIAPRRKLFLMDTCESGERGDDDVAPPAVAGARGLRARTSRALVLRPGRRRTLDRRFLFDRDRYIYNDLVRRSGAIVLSSSQGAELSYELDQFENGAFTEAILRALTSRAADRDGDGAVSIDELTAYVGPAVAASTARRQHPAVDRDNLAVRLRLPVVAVRAPTGSPGPAPVRRGCACGQGGGASWGAVLLLLAAALAARRRARASSAAVPGAGSSARRCGRRCPTRPW